MRILITGSNGFLGKHVIKELNNGSHKLFTPLHYELNLLDESRYMCGCCLKDTAINNIVNFIIKHNIDAIIHLAGNVGGIGYNQNNQGKLLYENLQMGINILEAARLASVKKVVMLGTTCSYPAEPKTIPFREEEIFDGMPEITNSGYGIAKRTLIKMGIEYNKQYDMDIINLIPANMAGEFDHFEDDRSHVIPAIIKKFENPIVDCKCSSMCSYVKLWGTGNVSREFLYAGDCARAIAMALEKDTGSEPINLGTGQEITIKQLAELICRIGKYDSEIVWDNSKPDGQKRRCLDIIRAKNLLDWEAITPLEETIKRTINWYRNENIK